MSMADLKRSLFFEFFGSDKRFQPLAFPVVYLQWKVFGTNFLMYHLTTIGVHALNATLLFLLVRRLAPSALFSLFIAALFLTAATHLDAIAWTVHTYVLLQVSCILLAVLFLLEWQRSSRPALLYLSYLFIFIQMFFTEAGVVFPLLLFAGTLVLWRHNRATMGDAVRRSAILTIGVYAVFLLAFGVFAILDPRSMPGELLSSGNILRAIWGTIIHFGSSALLHNTVYSSEIVVDDMVYFVPITWPSLSPTSGTAIGLVIGNTVAVIAVVTLLLQLRVPPSGRRSLVLLVALGGLAFSFLLLLVRPTSYAISQSRYAYIPTLTVVSLLAILLAQRFRPDLAGLAGKNDPGLGRFRKVAIVLAIGCLVVLSMGRTMTGAQEVASARADTNGVYYAAREFVAEPENAGARLFVSASTYPSHEKLAWGADIIPDLFLSSQAVTKNLSEATHVLREGPIIEQAPMRSMPRIEFAGRGGNGEFYQDLSDQASELAGRLVTLNVTARAALCEAVAPFIWSDVGGYVMGDFFTAAEELECREVTIAIPQDAKAVRVGLAFTRTTLAWVSELDFREVTSNTGNLLPNSDLKRWSAGGGPFTDAGDMWADGWLIDLRGESEMAVSRVVEQSGETIALAEYSHDDESYLVCNVPNPDSLIGHTATLSAMLRADAGKAVRLSMEWDREGGAWSDFHPGDGNWHLMSLAATVPEDGVDFLTLSVVLDRDCSVQIKSPTLMTTLSRPGNLLENPTFQGWDEDSLPVSAGPVAMEVADGWWQSVEGESALSSWVVEVAPPAATANPDDFSVRFGLMPTGWPGEPLEMFGFTSATRENPEGWFLRLLYGVGADSPQAGYPRLELGHREGTSEQVVFCSRPLPTETRMNHYVVGRDHGVFYVILNGELVEKRADNTGEAFRDMELELGEVYSYVYPYYQHPVPYFAYTHVQVGESEMSVADKPLGHVFGEISFNVYGFMPYHVSLGW